MLLCAGEALIDMLPRTSQTGEPAFAPYSGGAVFNTAIAAARLNMSVGFFSGISTDLFGQQLTRALDAAGVDVSLAKRSERPTTLAFVALVKGEARYTFYDEGTAGRMLSPSHLPPVPADVEAAFFGGISLMVEPCAEAYGIFLERLCSDRLIMIDPNIRPGFITDAARYRDRLRDLISRSDIVKLSVDDLRWLRGDGDPDALAREILELGPRLVLVTRGAEGVSAYREGPALHIPARHVDVVDTVGAGDTFNAGFLAGLYDTKTMTKAAFGHSALRDETLTHAVTLGVQAAAITVSRAGANPPVRSELA